MDDRSIHREWIDLHGETEPDGESSEQTSRPSAEAGPEQPAPSKSFFARFRKNRGPVQRRFLAVAPDAGNLAVLLECLYTARLLQKRHNNESERVYAAALVHPDNRALMESTGVFDELLDWNPGTHDGREDRRELRGLMLDFGADILYMPDGNLRLQLAGFFAGARVRIGGVRNRLLSRILRYYKVHNEDDLERLKQRGFDLYPELSDLTFSAEFAPPPGTPKSDYVVISLFDAHDLTGGWPVGHAARLVRRMGELNAAAVIPVPPVPPHLSPAEREDREKRIEAETAFIQKQCEAVVLRDCLPGDRAGIMARAKAVIAPAGPETILASILKVPVVVLHDMKTYRNHPGHVRPPNLHPEATDGRDAASSLREALIHPGALLNRQNPDYPLTSYFIKLADSLERHIMPSVDECVKSCPTCSFASCVEFISPERVFEQLKKTLLPF